MGTLRAGKGPHYLDQVHAELLLALRRERVAFFVMVAGQGGLEAPAFGFHVAGTGQEVRQFLADVIASAESELAEVDSALAKAAAAAE